jgi:hypothetical protein
VRKKEAVMVPEGFGRDSSPVRKTFLITEWPADRAEKWGLRAILAYNRGGGEIPLEALGGGMETIFWLGINTFLRGNMQSDEVIPILDELMECVQLIRDPKARGPDGNPVVSAIVSPDDIEEIRTRLWLRSEVLRVHTGFSPAEAISAFLSKMMAPRENSKTTQTSPE